MKLLGRMSEYTIWVLPEYLESITELRLSFPDHEVEATRDLSARDGVWYLLAMPEDGRIVLYNQEAKPKGWTWQQLCEVAEKTKILIAASPLTNSNVIDLEPIPEDVEARKEYNTWLQTQIGNGRI